MSRFFVKDIRCEKVWDEVGDAYGYLTLIVSIEYKTDDDISRWLTIVKADDVEIGIPGFYADDEDRFEQYRNYFDDSITINKGKEGAKTDSDFTPERIDNFEGIDLNCEASFNEHGDMYGGIYDQIIFNKKDNEAAPFIRFVIALITSEENEISKLVNLVKGRYIDEVNIPVCEEERRFMANR